MGVFRFLPNSPTDVIFAILPCAGTFLDSNAIACFILFIVLRAMSEH
jgi:cell division protein FtsW (lipid II flippase)